MGECITDFHLHWIIYDLDCKTIPLYPYAMDIYSGRREALNEPVNEGYIITEQQPQSPGPNQWLKWVVICVVLVIMMGGTTSVVMTIKNTTESFTKASDKQNEQVKKILNEGNASSTAQSSFGLVSKIQAQQNNPFDESTLYQNPFNDVSNPFDQLVQQ